MSLSTRLGIALLAVCAAYAALALLPQFSKARNPGSVAYLQWARESVARSEKTQKKLISLGFGYTAGCNTFLLEHLIATCVDLRLDEEDSSDEFREALLNRIVLDCDSSKAQQDPTADQLCSGETWPPFVRLSVTFFQAARGAHADGSTSTTRTATFHTKFWINRRRG